MTGQNPPSTTAPTTMTDLRALITDALSRVDDWRGVTDPKILADAMVYELQLNSRMADAIRAYAATERSALINQDGHTSAYEAMRKLSREAPRIAERAFTEWQGDDSAN